jgi:hypothetical protein
MAELNEQPVAASEDMQGVFASGAMLDSHQMDMDTGRLLPSLTVWSGYDS